MNQHAANVIKALGGTAAVAKIFKIRMPSVAAWKREGIPRARVMFLKVVHAAELRGIDLDAATSGKPSSDAQAARHE